MIKPNDIKHYLISGIFISSLLAVCSLTIFMLNKEENFFSSKIQINTEVKNAQNLKEGAVLQLKGVKVGSISAIQFKNITTLVITISINTKYKEWVKKDSIITFKTQGVLGDKYLEIDGGTDTAPSIEEGDYLATVESFQIEHIITKSEDLVIEVRNTFSKLNKILSNVENNRLEKILLNLEHLTANTNKIMNNINEKNVNQTITNLKHSSESLTKITKRIEDGPGTLHAIIYDQSLHEDLRSLLGGANRSKVLKYFIRESIKKSEK